MTHTAVAYTNQHDSAEAARSLSEQIVEQIGVAPDALVVFASARFDYEALLRGLDDAIRPRLMVGSSSAGEFTATQRGEGTACVLALKSDEIQLAAGVGHAVSEDRGRAAGDLLSTFAGLSGQDVSYRTALVMTDALAGHADALVDELTRRTSGKYQFAGGGAGDDAKFARTHVFHGTSAHTDAVVALEMLSHKPLGIGVGHGWSAASKPLRVTEADGMRLVSLNGFPAIEAFEQHAEATGQTVDRQDPLPFFLHNILGIDTGAGYRLRVPLSVADDGSVNCASEIPAGARVHIMRTTSESAVTAATRATEAALGRLGGRKPSAALFFDCVATRLRMGDAFGFELDSVTKLLDGANMVGCNTYGQIARAEGQFGGFHNCTAVVMVLPS